MTVLLPTLIHSKTKVQCLCVLVFLSVPLSTMGEVVPAGGGPCRHSITREHLLTLQHLMDNQLRNGCTVNYTFIERRGLSKCCFVKAALPWILELLSSSFRYRRGSVNHGHVLTLRTLILNLYSQGCVPMMDEELENKPEHLERPFSGSPSEALQMALEVLSTYWELVTSAGGPVNWNCQREYTPVSAATTKAPYTKSPPAITAEASYTTSPPAAATIEASYTTSPAAEHPTTSLPTQHFMTERAVMSSVVSASQMSPQTHLYKYGFIVTSVCGGLMFMLTLYCVILQKALKDQLTAGTEHISSN